MTEPEGQYEPTLADVLAAVTALAQGVADLRREVTRSEARIVSRIGDATQIAQNAKADLAAHAAYVEMHHPA